MTPDLKCSPLVPLIPQLTANRTSRSAQFAVATRFSKALPTWRRPAPWANGSIESMYRAVFSMDLLMLYGDQLKFFDFNPDIKTAATKFN